MMHTKTNNSNLILTSQHLKLTEFKSDSTGGNLTCLDWPGDLPNLLDPESISSRMTQFDMYLQFEMIWSEISKSSTWNNYQITFFFKQYYPNYAFAASSWCASSAFCVGRPWSHRHKGISKDRELGVPGLCVRWRRDALHTSKMVALYQISFH
jgi:hypothetical protein